MSGLFSTLKNAGKHLLAKSRYDTASQWRPELGSMYDLKANDLDGKPFDLSQLKGKVTLVCNVASECGYVRQQRTALHRTALTSDGTHPNRPVEWRAKAILTAAVFVGWLCWWQTKCGYQFLEEEQQKYAKRGFTVLAFPCNQFGGQESGGPKDIRESLHTPHTAATAPDASTVNLCCAVCVLAGAAAAHTRAGLLASVVLLSCCPPVSFAVTSYHATFPLLEKTDVNGPSTHPVFSYLKAVYPGDVTWNFHGLFVVNEQGIPVRRFTKEPYPEIDAFIGKTLDERDAAAAAAGGQPAQQTAADSAQTAA